MPVNHFINRPEESKIPSELMVGDTVYIIQKEDQGTRDINKLVLGQIVHIYSSGNYYENGVKVQILLDERDWRYESMGRCLSLYQRYSCRLSVAREQLVAHSRICHADTKGCNRRKDPQTDILKILHFTR